MDLDEDYRENPEEIRNYEGKWKTKKFRSKFKDEHH